MSARESQAVRRVTCSATSSFPMRKRRFHLQALLCWPRIFVSFLSLLSLSSAVPCTLNFFREHQGDRSRNSLFSLAFPFSLCLCPVYFPLFV